MEINSLHSSLEKYLEQVERYMVQGGVDIVGLSTGIPMLDDALGGLRPSAQYVLGGRPGMGKTSLALTIAYYIAKEKHSTLILSLEMDASLLSLRTLSMQTGIPSKKIERGRITQDELRVLKDVLTITEAMNFNVIDTSMDSKYFVKHVKAYQDKFGLEFLVVDYLSLFRDENIQGDNERLARISANMFEVSRQCKIPVLSLAQLNREVERRENHMPILSDLRDSGAIEQDAFAVLFTYRPHYYKMMFDKEPSVEVETDAQIIVAKNRQGEANIFIPVHFHPKQTLWLPPDVEIQRPPSIKKGLL